MSALQKTFTSPQGQPLSGHTVRITRSRDGQPASVYTVAEGGQGVAYPSHNIELGDNGVLSVWLADGLYDLAVYLGATLVTTFYRVQVGSSWVAATGSFHSRAEAVAAAAQGAIPAYVNTVSVQGYSVALDGGAAKFSRLTSTQLLALGISAPALALCTFPDASGDQWVLDMRDPTLASIGVMGQPLGVQPSTTLADDCSAAIALLSEYSSKLRANALILYDDRNYYLHNDLLLNANIGLSGDYPGRDTRSLDDIDAVGGIDYMPGMVIRSGKSVQIDDGFYAQHLCLKRAGIVVHTDLRGALDAQLTFTGTGLVKKGTGSARNITIDRLVLYGFGFGADFHKMHGLRVGDAYGDCNTLVMIRDSGETCYIDHCKRKPILTNNSAIDSHTVQVTALYDSGGFVGMTLAEDVTALGLTTGQRVGNQKMPDAFVSVRRTVTVLDANNVVLEGQAWDPAYASFTLSEKASISWQAGCSSGVVAFYNSGGKVGVQTRISMPFIAGHFALLGCGDLAPRGFRKILARNSATDFTFDAPWDPALSSFSLTDAEFAAMPNNRRHNDVVSYWGTTQGYGAALVDSDGARIRYANRGGSGVFCSSAASLLEGSNEGASIGELDLDDIDTVGVEVTQPRVVVTGPYKSTGIAMWVNTETASDVIYGYGLQLTDNGQASLKVSTGGAVLSGVRIRGPGRVILDNISRLTVLEGDFTPASIVSGSASDKRRTSLRWRAGSNYETHQIAGMWAMWAWDSSGVATRALDITATGVTSLVPFTAPPKVVEVTSGAQTLTSALHGADINLVGSTGNGISLDASTVYDGFRVVIRNLRGSDWAWPAVTNGTIQIMGFYVGTPTKLRNNGEMTLTVRNRSGAWYVYLRGDLTT